MGGYDDYGTAGVTRHVGWSDGDDTWVACTRRPRVAVRGTDRVGALEALDDAVRAVFEEPTVRTVRPVLDTREAPEPGRRGNPA